MLSIDDDRDGKSGVCSVIGRIELLLKNSESGGVDGFSIVYSRGSYSDASLGRKSAADIGTDRLRRSLERKNQYEIIKCS